MTICGITLGQLEDLLHRTDLRKELQKVVSQDPMLSVILAGLMSTLSIMEMYLAVYPNYEDVLELAQSVKTTSVHLQAMQDRLGSLAFLASVLEGPILKKFTINQECLRAAFRGGYTTTDSMIQWQVGTNGDWVGLASQLIRGQTAGAFYFCENIKDTVLSGFTDQTFAAHTKYGCYEGEHREKGNYGQLPRNCDRVKCFEARCHGKEATIMVSCQENYFIKNLKVRSATFKCSSRADYPKTWINRDQYKEQWMVRWSCKVEATGATMSLNNMKQCTLQPDAPTKTFTSDRQNLKKLPYDPRRFFQIESK